MNENAKRWVAALRSGQYAQTTGTLHRLDQFLEKPAGYCCLGVACDLYQQAGNPLPVKDTGGPDNYRAYGGAASALPPVVQEWLGLRTPGGTCHLAGEHTSLAEINDTGTSFTEIADIIESEPEGLF